MRYLCTASAFFLNSNLDNVIVRIIYYAERS